MLPAHPRAALKRLAALALVLLACADPPGAAVTDIRVVTTDRGDPFSLGTFDTFTVRVSQDDGPVVESTTVLGETFDVGVVIDSLLADTRLRIFMDGEEPLHGAPPRFVPWVTGGVRVAVGPPGACEVVPSFALATTADERIARVGAGVVRVDTYVMVLGGEGTDRVDVLELLLLAKVEPKEPQDLEPIPREGPVVAAPLGDTQALVVSDREAFTYDLGVNPRMMMSRIALLTLHDGRSSQSALLERPGRGVFVAGPGEDFSFVALDGAVLMGSFTIPRIQPALAEIGGRIVVVGGNDTGPLVEIVDPDRATSSALSLDGVAPNPRMLRAGDVLWLLGDAGEPSRVLRSCPVCELEEGPESPAGTPHGDLLVGDAVWRAVLNPDTRAPELELVAPLAAARQGAFAFPYESGMVLTGLGADEAGLRGDVELCFPPVLTPL